MAPLCYTLLKGEREASLFAHLIKIREVILRIYVTRTDKSVGNSLTLGPVSLITAFPISEKLSLPVISHRFQLSTQGFV